MQAFYRPETRMPYYRAYFVGQDGHFLKSVILECDNDNAAIEFAKQIVDGLDVEVWQQDRMIEKLASK
jgi:hypothetical protein